MVHILVTWLALAWPVKLLAPALLAASKDFWTEQLAPFNASNVVALLGDLYLLPGNPAYALSDLGPLEYLPSCGLMAIALFGAWVCRRSPQIRFVFLAAISMPALVVGLSAVKSLLITRYFLSAIPFALLLMANGGAVASRFRWSGVLAGILCLGIVLHGVDTAISKRKFDPSPAIAEIRKYEAATVLTVGRPRIASVLAFYARNEPIAKAENVEPGQVDVDFMASLLEKGPVILIADRSFERGLAGRLPAGSLSCRQHIIDSSLRIVFVTADQDSLGRAAIHGCAATISN